MRKHVVHLGAKDIDAADGGAILEDIIDGFRASDALAQCAASAPADGVLSLRLDIGIPGSGGGFFVHAGGELAATAAGRCIVERLQAMGAAVSLPPTLSGAVRFLAIELPLPGDARPPS